MVKTISKLVLLLFVLAGTASVRAQVTVAEDWTQTDCDGVEHNLFNTLDTGTAVVMEFVMLDGCMPCINAAHWMEPVIDAYNIAYADRVQWYTFGYNDTYTCSALTEWKTDNEIGCNAQFMLGADISSYYGGMGMPTIVVVGRNTHNVYFNQFGFVPADTVEFSEAISHALGLTDPEVGIETIEKNVIDIYPNPVHDILLLTGNDLIHATYTISGIAGNAVLSGVCTENGIYVGELPAGMYYLTMHKDNTITTASFVRAH